MSHERRERRPDVSGSTLCWLRWWAEMLDSRYRVPGTNIRFGIDPILSLVPGIGDLASPVFAMALVAQGLRQGVPRLVLLRMIGNALFDACLGIVPAAGTIADVFFRANQRNLALLERHARGLTRPTAGDYVFVFGAAALLGMLVLVPVILAIWVAYLVQSRWPL